MPAVTAAMNLPVLRSNSFQLTVGTTTFTAITPPSVVIQKLTTLQTGGVTPVNPAMIQTAGAGTNGGVLPANSQINAFRLFFAGGTVAPSWLKVGSAVKFVANTSAGYRVNTFGQISNVASDGTYVDLPVSNCALSGALTADVLTNTPLLTLTIQAQKIIFSTPTSNTAVVTITDGVDVNGVCGWSQDIPVGSSGFVLDAPSGAKLTVADYFVKAASSQILLIKFL